VFVYAYTNNSNNSITANSNKIITIIIIRIRVVSWEISGNFQVAKISEINSYLYANVCKLKNIPISAPYRPKY